MAGVLAFDTSNYTTSAAFPGCEDWPRRECVAAFAG